MRKNDLMKFAALALCAVSLGGIAQAAENFDFTSENGGFRVQNGGSPSNPWLYGTYAVTPGGGNSWYTTGSDGVGAPSVSYLLSPFLRVQTAGQVWGSFLHRFNFEVTGGTNWDGGQFQYRLNEGSWQPVTMLFGETYNGVVRGNNVLSNSMAFTAASSQNEVPFYVQTRFQLGSGTPSLFNANDLVEFRFAAAWDEFTLASAPNWQVGNMLLNNLVVQPIPEPTIGAFAALGGVCLLLLRRRS